MKLTKDNLQKAFLAGLLSVGGLCFYCFGIIAPLGEREDKALKDIVKLNDNIKDATGKVARKNSMEAGDLYAEPARQTYAVMKAKIPTGQPVAWFPTKLSGFFKQQGIPKQAFRAQKEQPEPDYPGYKTSVWAVDIPGVGFTTFGVALASLENQEGLMEITALQVDSVPKEPGNNNVQLTISTLVKIEK